MRSILKIKSAAEKGEVHRPTKAKKTLKTPTTVRDKQKKDDDTLKLQKQLTRQIVALQGAIRKELPTLGKLRGEIVQKTEKAIIAGDEIIDAAKSRANSIINDAHSTRTKATDLLNKAENLSKKLDTKQKILKESAIELIQVAKDAEGTRKAANDKLQSAQRNEQITTEKRNQAQELLDTMLSLLLAVLEKVTPIAADSDTLLRTISANVAKADKMYSEILDMEKVVKLGKESNTTRSVELDKKEIWLEDRRKLIGRAEKEVEKSGK